MHETCLIIIRILSLHYSIEVIRRKKWGGWEGEVVALKNLKTMFTKGHQEGFW